MYEGTFPPSDAAHAAIKSLTTSEVLMILMSAVDGLNQAEPVTTSYDPGRSPAAALKVDPGNVLDLHAFCAERVYERIASAAERREPADVAEELRRLHALDVLVARAKRHPESGDTAAQHLRRTASQDRDHDGYQSEWTPTPRRGRLRAMATAGAAVISALPGHAHDSRLGRRRA
jgi:hypothetical protein